MILKTVINNIIGAYVPHTYDYVTSDGAIVSIIPNGISGVDIEYLGALVLLAITIYCIFRLVGVLVNGK